ncbi:MAG: hypothetical protein J6A30_03365 [Ruminococcus sp.]|nr:hypothetical protein [Ruminococcus sp.]
MKLKKIAIAALAAMTMATGAMGITASANNHYDNPYNDFTISRWTNYTYADSKTDKTSATIMVQDTNPDGCKMTVRVYNGSKVDRTYGAAKIVGTSSYYTYLPNTVYESGDRSACLGFLIYSTPTGASSFVSSGVWSPDSV